MSGTAGQTDAGQRLINVSDLEHVRKRMPPRSDHPEFLTHALRWFEDVLALAEHLAAELREKA